MTWRDDMEAFAMEFARVFGEARAARLLAFALIATMCLALLLEACAPKIYLLKDERLKRAHYE